MSHLGLCLIWDYVSFGIMSHLGLCLIWDDVTFNIQSLVIMSFGVMPFQVYIIRDYVVIMVSVYHAPNPTLPNIPYNWKALIEYFLCVKE